MEEYRPVEEWRFSATSSVKLVLGFSPVLRLHPGERLLRRRNRPLHIFLAMRRPEKCRLILRGGKYTPLSSMLRKNFPNASVFDFDAESQSVTGPSWKNHVNIDPTRLWHSATPASFAAAATPSDQLTAQLFEPRINLALAVAQLLQHRASRRHRQRIPRKRPCLIHRPQRRNEIHDFLGAAISPHRQASANDLSHRRQVRLDVVQLLRSANATRNPVITSSKISTDRSRSVIKRSPTR